jgi:hypothetical protein
MFFVSSTGIPVSGDTYIVGSGTSTAVFVATGAGFGATGFGSSFFPPNAKTSATIATTATTATKIIIFDFLLSLMFTSLPSFATLRSLSLIHMPPGNVSGKLSK